MNLYWRALLEFDLPAVNQIADVIHTTHPEDAAIFAERFHLYPAGCQALVSVDTGHIVGYLISHPGLYGFPPKLDSFLGALPEHPTTYYIHDIGLLPGVQHYGYAHKIVEQIIGHAVLSGFDNISLVAVNDSSRFWRQHGFRRAILNIVLEGYGPDALYMTRTF